MAILDDIASVSFRDQTAVITGTTNGLGLAISEELVRRQIATLIMGVRNIQKGEEVKAQLLANPTWHSRNPSVVIHVVELQMRDYESVIAFATEVKVLTQTVDLVLLNAGVGGLDFETTQSGHEKIMQVNVYSNALLVLELLPLLQETAILKSRPSRLTWVGSFVQMDHSLTKRAVPMERRVMDHFDDKSCFDGATRYQDSKLIGTMVVKQLAQRIDKKTVIFNEVSPGPVLTNFGAIYPFYFRAMIAIAGAFASKRKSLAEGVNKYLHAIALVGKESHGAYISNYEIAQ
ncbi:uncharacterized protein PFLUO_LOCUS4604 [Penicillium psychrofluorescens]|uniref:uncharacterized protein n=1 Tax=Penicillium psychrofluorescens TaxID=3158075 RepID=UPI003CCD04E5